MKIRRSIITNSVAIIIIFGHLAVFAAGLAIGVFELLEGSDSIQTLLMASPVLSVTSAAAFTFITKHNGYYTSNYISFPYAIVAITFPVFLLGLILVSFFTFWKQADVFGPEKLKISLGAIETFFGFYIGSLSKTLFEVDK